MNRIPRVCVVWAALGLAAMLPAAACNGGGGGGAGGTGGSTNPCDGVECETAGGWGCDPADGLCKCGGPGGILCVEGQVCSTDPSPTCVSSLCDLADCDRGMTCDPLDGQCRCGGSGGPSCGESQSCDPSTRTCEPGLCGDVECSRGQTCDPGDGVCKCGSAPCGAGQRCELGACAAADLCEGVTCGGGQTCDPDDGICKCGGAACSFGQRCEAGSCVADTCAGVNCADNTSCNPADGMCHCGGGTGQVCTAGQACVEEPDGSGTFACQGNDLCADAATRCRGGTTCDPGDGQCRCGGVGATAPVCGGNQTCDIPTKTCLGGDRCVSVRCDQVPGTSCDPEDGICKCGGLGGTACLQGQVCVSVEDAPTCADSCNPVLNPTGCTGEAAGCYWDASQRQAYCAIPGTATRDSGCRAVLDCEAGLHCTVSSASPVCRPFCRVPSGGEADTCPGDDICLQLDGAPAGVGTCRTVN